MLNGLLPAMSAGLSHTASPGTAASVISRPQTQMAFATPVYSVT